MRLTILTLALVAFVVSLSMSNAIVIVKRQGDYVPLQHLPPKQNERQQRKRSHPHPHPHPTPSPIPSSYPHDLKKTIQLLQALPFGGKLFCDAYLYFERPKTSTTTLETTIVQTQKTTDVYTTSTTPTSSVTETSTTTVAATTDITVTDTEHVTATESNTQLSTEYATTTSYIYPNGRRRRSVAAGKVEIPQNLQQYKSLLSQACYFIEYGKTTPDRGTKTSSTTSVTTQHVPVTTTVAAAAVTETTTVGQTDTLTVTDTDTVTRTTTDATSTTVVATNTVTSPSPTTTLLCPGPGSVVGAASGTNTVTYDQYYIGRARTLNPNNPGNQSPSRPPISKTLDSSSFGQSDCSAAVKACADFSAQGSGAYFTFDLHFSQSSSSWQCIAYYDQTNDPSLFNVVNDDVIQGYGYYAVATS